MRVLFRVVHRYSQGFALGDEISEALSDRLVDGWREGHARSTPLSPLDVKNAGRFAEGCRCLALATRRSQLQLKTLPFLVDAPAIEPRPTYAPIVVDRREEDAAAPTTYDAMRRRISASRATPNASMFSALALASPDGTI
jgi:hypothetical protein